MVRIAGLHVVDEAKLKAIDHETLKTWFAGPELELIFAHLLSLRNLHDLEVRLASRTGGAA